MTPMIESPSKSVIRSVPAITLIPHRTLLITTRTTKTAKAAKTKAKESGHFSSSGAEAMAMTTKTPRMRMAITFFMELPPVFSIQSFFEGA